MIRSVVLCALLLGAANAARQIPVNPSPPPPGPSSDNVPGAVLSFVAPDYSSSTWTSAQSNALCAGLVANYTSLYDKKYIMCSVKGVVDTTAHSAAAVQTWMYWADFYGSTDEQKNSATQSRDLFINTLYNSPVLSIGTKTVNVNDTCNASWQPGTSTESSGVYTSIANMPYVECREAIRGIAAETYDSTTGKCTTPTAPSTPITTVEGLCFTNKVDSSVGAYGIDNGKTCPRGAGYIQAVSAPSAVAFASTGGNSVGFVMTAGPSSLIKSLNIATDSVNAAAVGSSFQAGMSFVKIGGISTGDISVAGTGCANADVVDLLSNVPQLVTGSLFAASATGGASLTVMVDFSKAGCTTAPLFKDVAVAPDDVALTHAWSPFCDTNIGFYQAFNKFCDTASATGCQGAAKPVCAGCGTSSDNVMFTYSGSNAGKACRSGAYAKSSGVVGAPTDVQAAGFAGTSCIGVGVANLGATDVDNAKPMLRSTSPVPYPYTANQYAFPSGDISCPAGTTTPSATCASSGSFPTTSVVAYQSGVLTTATGSPSKYQAIAIDSEFGTMCSTPRVNSPIGANLKSSSIAGGYYLGASEGVGVVKGAGTCNTYSKWWNGGTGTAGNKISSYNSDMANLPSLFAAPIVGPTPAPAPTPSPVAPKPVAPKPVPSPPPSLVCRYEGSYHFTPLYAPCNKYYITSGTTSDCSYNLVTLRTKNNLGGKLNRIRWRVSTIAEQGISKPTRMTAEARVAARGSCTNRYLAAPSDPTTLKVGGSSWQWQIRPYPDSDKCDHVNLISQNRIDTTAFLQVPRACDRFRYNATDGGRQRFRAIKV
jgi:hypothetical protein